MKTDLFEGVDYYQLDDLFSEEHLLVRDAARSWVKRDVSPIINEYAQRAEFPSQLLNGLAEIGAFGPYIPEAYGGAGLDHISYGLIMQEIERGDSGVRSTASVQSSLVMFPIHAYGSEEQKQKFLPKLATGELMGCFGLTEPNHGSNPSGMESKFIDKGDHVELSGAKLWISNAPFADIAVVWAKNEEGRIHGLIVERGMEGFTTPETHNKWSLRASSTGELIFDKVKVPAALLSGTLVASGILQIFDIASYKLPDASINFCLLILGASVGCRFANKTFKEVASNSFHGLVATILLVLLGLLAAYIATFFVDTNFLSLILSFCPGGIYEVAVIAIAFDLEPDFVAFHHIIRLLFILFIVPIILKILENFNRLN